MSDSISRRSGNTTARGRTAVAVGVMLLIASDQVFRPGSHLRGTLRVLYYSYFLDVVLPFGMYLLMWQAEARVRFLRDWRLKALLVFGVASFAEVRRDSEYLCWDGRLTRLTLSCSPAECCWRSSRTSCFSGPCFPVGLLG